MGKTVPAKQEKALLPMLSAGASNREILKHFANLTPANIINNGYPSLVKITKEHGEEKAEKALGILLADSVIAFGEEFTQEQVLYFANEIRNVYYYFSLEDCFVVLQRLKSSKLYGKLCLNTYLTAFEQYAAERFKTAEEINYNKHQSYKEPNLRHYENVFKEPKRIGKFLKK